MTAPVTVRRWRWYFAALIVGTFVLYYPALDTSFLLDDIQNLHGLSLVSRDGILTYIFEGRSGPGGRPLALLSFALQHHSWPTDPFAFKLVNLLIHLAGAWLIFLITTELAPYLGIRRKNGAGLLSTMVAGLWLLHPVQLSSVLYVVQRMNLLAGFFTLLGVYLYLRLRSKDLGTKNLLLLSGAIYGCTVLAVLGKENGILLPVYILTLELVLLRGEGITVVQRRRILCITAIPVVLMLTYLAWSAKAIIAGYDYRPFSLSQRLLTEAGIVLDYLKIILLPHPSEFTLFHDDYPVTTSLTGNGGGMYAVAVLAALILSAWLLRRKARIYSFAVTWFLAGHLLESSFIPLELYFEHRNYIPSFGVLLLAGVCLVRLAYSVETRWVSVILLLAYPSITLAITILQLQLWSDPYKQAVVWAEEHPTSRRALNNLWNIHLIYGEKEKARTDLARLEGLNPGDLYPWLKQLTVTYCYDQKRYNNNRWQALYKRAQQAKYVDHVARDEIGYLLQQIALGQCQFPDLAGLRRLVYDMAENTSFKGEIGYLYEYAATVSVLMHDENSALKDINKAIMHLPNIDNRTFKMRILLALKRYDEARKLLDEMESQAVSSPGNYVKLSHAKSIFKQQLKDNSSR
jgi:hypothetical protein